MSRWLVIAMFSYCGPIAAAGDVLFASDEAISLTIEAPLAALLSDQDKKPGYRDAKLRYLDQNGVEHILGIGIRPRGQTRRKPHVCDFPPLRLNFRKDSVARTVFAGQDKLKLVTHCRDNNKVYQQYVLQEYLIYRMLNELTEQSFRVRPLNVTYVSTDSDRKPLTSYAFLIEDRDQMAARNGFVYQKPQVIQWYQLDPEAANVFEVFQYLIGNTDWSFQSAPRGNPCCHNVVIIARDEGTLVPVPYDFDFAGIISTSYARPGRSLKIRDVRTRLYRGFCRPSDILEATLTRFRQHRRAIYEIYHAGLGGPGKKKTLKYLDRFYDTINNPKRLKRQIIQACRYGEPRLSR